MTSTMAAIITVLLCVCVVSVVSAMPDTGRVSTFVRRQTNSSLAADAVNANPDETVSQYVASLQPVVAPPNTDLTSRDFEQNGAYEESIFTVDNNGVMQSFNISLQGCLKMGTAAGRYTFSNGTTSDNVELLDISSDFDSIVASSRTGSAAYRKISHTLYDNAQTATDEANAFLNSTVCGWGTVQSDGETGGHDELRCLLQVGFPNSSVLILTGFVGVAAAIASKLWAAIQVPDLHSTSVTGPNVTNVTGQTFTSETGQNVTMARLVAASAVTIMLFFCSSMILNIAQIGFRVHPNEGLNQAAAIAWQRRVVAAAAMAAAAASPEDECIEPAELEAAMSGIETADDSDLALQPFDATDAAIAAEPAC